MKGALGLLAIFAVVWVSWMSWEWLRNPKRRWRNNKKE